MRAPTNDERYDPTKSNLNVSQYCFLDEPKPARCWNRFAAKVLHRTLKPCLAKYLAFVMPDPVAFDCGGAFWVDLVVLQNTIHDDRNYEAWGFQ